MSWATQALAAVVALALALGISFSISTTSSSSPHFAISLENPVVVLLLVLLSAPLIAGATRGLPPAPASRSQPMPTASLRHLFDASGAVLVEPALCSDPASRREAAEEAKKEGNLCFAADSFLDAACSYARGLAVLSSREGGGGGGGADEGESSASAGAGEGGKGLACGVRVAVSGQGGGLEKEGMIAYDNEDGTYDIVTDENEDLDGIPSSLIRVLPSSQDAPDLVLEASLALNAAKCAFKLCDLELTEALATKAIFRDPQRASAYFVRGRARLAMPHLDDARDDLNKAVQGEPRNNEYIRTLNDCLGRVRDRKASSKRMAQMFLGHMKQEGVDIGGSLMPPPE